MDSFNNVLLFKDNRISNDIFQILNELENFCIVKKIDTVGYNESEIKAISKSEVESFLYTAKEFIETSEYIGQTVYDVRMPKILKDLYDSFILVYKNDKNELLFDTISNKFFVQNAMFEKEFMYISEKQYPEYKFKRHLGKE